MCQPRPKFKMDNRKRKPGENLDSEQPKTKKRNCDYCNATFNQKSHLDEHIQRIHTHDFQNKCDKCELGFTRKDRLLKHIANHHEHIICEQCGEQFIGRIARNKHKHLICEHCGDQFTNIGYLNNHTRQHIQKIQTRGAEEQVSPEEFLEDDEDSEEESAFNKTLLTKIWRIRGSKDPLSLMNDYKDRLKHYLTSLLIQNPRKFYIVMEVRMIKKDRKGTHQKITAYFRSQTRTLLRSTQINAMLEESSTKINTSFENYLQRGSGWILESIDYLKVFTAIYEPIRGKSYVPTPKSIVMKKAVINIRNEDEKCFEYAIIALQHFDKIVQKDASRPAQ